MGNIFRLRSRKESLAETLQNIPLFQELSPKELAILEKLVHIRTYDAGEPVFVETEPGAGMYTIRTGRADIVLIAIPVASTIKVIGQEFYTNYQLQVRT